MLNFGFALDSRFLKLTVNSTFPTGVSNRCFMLTGVKAELFFLEDYNTTFLVSDRTLM